MNKKKIIFEIIKKLSGNKKVKINDTSNLIKLNYLDSFGYVELATILEKKFKIKINQSEFFNIKNANIKNLKL